MRRLVLLICLFFVTPCFAAREYVVEASYGNEFVINGEKFSAQTFCSSINEGDKVIFLEGSPFGACASAAIYDLDTEVKCKLWCK